MAVELKAVDRWELPAIQDQIIETYRAVFALPPYRETEADVARFAERLPRHAARDGFRCVVSIDGGRVLGFAYGYLGRPDQWGHDLITAAVAPEVAERWLAGVFELVELAVQPAAQGRGVGRGLHDALLRTVDAPTAVAFTPQHDNPALGFYRRLGWETLLDGFRFSVDSVPHSVIGRRLGREEHRSVP